MGEHLIDGEFQSDKYPWCKRGFVPLKLTDPMAHRPLSDYAQTRRAVDPEFSDDLEEALRLKGYKTEPTADAALRCTATGIEGGYPSQQCCLVGGHDLPHDFTPTVRLSAFIEEMREAAPRKDGVVTTPQSSTTLPTHRISGAGDAVLREGLRVAVEVLRVEHSATHDPAEPRCETCLAIGAVAAAALAAHPAQGGK